MATITITPGNSFTPTETVTSTKLNDLGSPTAALAAGSIGTADIADDAITPALIADNAVTTPAILDANVTFAKLTDVIDDDTMATASATKLATSESIKAYVDNSTSRPSYVKLTGGTIALSHTSDGTYTWNKSDFTGTNIDTSSITGLWVLCFGSSRFNGNFTQVNYTFPDGTIEPIFRTDASGTPEDHTTGNTVLTFIPVGTDQTEIVLTLSSSTSYGRAITLVGVQQFV